MSRKPSTPTAKSGAGAAGIGGAAARYAVRWTLSLRVKQHLFSPGVRYGKPADFGGSQHETGGRSGGFGAERQGGSYVGVYHKLGVGCIIDVDARIRMIDGKDLPTNSLSLPLGWPEGYSEMVGGVSLARGGKLSLEGSGGGLGCLGSDTGWGFGQCLRDIEQDLPQYLYCDTNVFANTVYTPPTFKSPLHTEGFYH